MKISFTSTRFVSPGYAAREVDDLLDRLEAALLRGDGSFTPQQLEETRFTPTRFREGYDIDEVDTFLDGVAQRWVSGEERYDPLLDHTAEVRAPESAVAGGAGSGPFAPHPAQARPGLLARLFGTRR